jgi:hypothetical protein
MTVFGFHVLDRTLRLCVGTWEGDYNSLSANMLKGIAHLIVAFGDALKDDIFKERIGKFSSREIGRTAKERKAGSYGYAEAMLIAYNKKMKTPLRWSKLYMKKSCALNDDFDMEYDESDLNTRAKKKIQRKFEFTSSFLPANKLTFDVFIFSYKRR